MSHNNQSGKFFYFIVWFSLIVFVQNFFFIDRIEIIKKLIF